MSQKLFGLVVTNDVPYNPLHDQGYASMLILAALAGTLAAIPPARRAARVDVLRAVTTE